jgi:hypothetical protein
VRDPGGTEANILAAINDATEFLRTTADLVGGRHPPWKVGRPSRYSRDDLIFILLPVIAKQYDLPLTRSKHRHGTRVGVSACWIAAEALNALNYNVSEKAVEKIWQKRKVREARWEAYFRRLRRRSKANELLEAADEYIKARGGTF